MNKYRSAMDKIKVSSEMEERILKNLANEKKTYAELKKQSSFKWIRPAGTIAACLIFTLTVTASYTLFIKTNHNEHQKQIPQLADNNKTIVSHKKNQQIKATNHTDTAKGTESLAEKPVVNPSTNAGSAKITKSLAQRPMVKPSTNTSKVNEAKSLTQKPVIKPSTNAGSAKESKSLVQKPIVKPSASTSKAKESKGLTQKPVVKPSTVNSNVGKRNPQEGNQDFNTSVGTKNTEIVNSQSEKQQDNTNGGTENIKDSTPKQDEPILATSANDNEPIDSQNKGQICLSTNPISNTADIDTLKKTVPFELLVPAKLPTGYKIEKTSVISNDLAQIVYSDGNNKITYRSAPGTEDISGDYNQYSESSIIKSDNFDVTLKGANSMVNLATWNYNNCAYSISFSSGVAKDVVMSIINSLEK